MAGGGAESAASVLSSYPTVRRILAELPVQDLFRCINFNSVWECVCLGIVRSKLAALVVASEKQSDPEDSLPNFRAIMSHHLEICERVGRKPSYVIIFFTDELDITEVSELCELFGAETSVVAAEVQDVLVSSTSSADICKHHISAALFFSTEDAVHYHCDVTSYLNSPGTSDDNICPCLTLRRGQCQRLGQAARPVHYVRRADFNDPCTGEKVQFALYFSALFVRSLAFLEKDHLRDVATCTFRTNCFRVLQHQRSRKNNSCCPVYWGLKGVGREIRAKSIKFSPHHTMAQIERRLCRFRAAFGATNSAVALVFQDAQIADDEVARVIRKVFPQVPLLSVSGSLMMDLNRTEAFSLLHLDATSTFISKSVVLMVIAF
ncbi:uncharacterized protein LOC135375433 [Ornithodoros turicata]|uniref:uncharacterized protein LOC135375433 n=1 Tax=Ornithodoros turicata TaxID=34597 RepID=UPI00313934CE